MALSQEQQQAQELILAWMGEKGNPFFVLSGFAGTGKTYTVSELKNQRIGRIVFTAPTNKAVRVLRTSLTEPGYRPECCTIFNLLKLRLEANGEVKELSKPNPGDETLDLSDYSLIIVDEAGMIGKALFKVITDVAAAHPKVKWLFMGDPAQLPPVGEDTSLIWGYEGASLKTVMRFDNSLLKLATHLREEQEHFIPRVRLVQDWTLADGGVLKVDKLTGLKMIAESVALGDFVKPEHTKVVAWRNVTVQNYNNMIRQTLFPQVESAWVTGDRIILTQPAADLEDKPIGKTDDEGTVQRSSVAPHPLHPEFICWQLYVEFDHGMNGTLRVLHKDSQKEFNRQCEGYATLARAGAKKNWGLFWDLKDVFHQVRYAYALTAHRAQGSTYERTFVDWKDVMTNPNNREMMKCLYVACTRARKELVLL